MRDEILSYYQDELTYVRQMGAQFAREYPQIASKLALEQDACNDPHVERLLEGFAFLAARVRKKIDDQFPEITEALLNVVYPHFLRPIPSLTIVEFQLDPTQGKLTTGLPIPRETILESRPVGGERCKFRTVYKTTLWPIQMKLAEWTTPDRIAGVRSPESVAAIRLQLTCAPDVRFSQLELDDLSFCLNGERRLVYKLYELLCTRVNRIIVRDPTPKSTIEPEILHPSTLRPMGFREDEGALPYTGRSFIGYRHLQEYFAFPEKFLFFNLSGLNRIWKTTGRKEGQGYGGQAEIIFLLSSFEGAEYREALQMGITAKTFRLGCTPIINLFPQTAESINLDERKSEYPIIPDVRRQDSLEVFSVDEVRGMAPQTREPLKYEPFFAFRHAGDARRQQTFYVANRRPSTRSDDQGTDVTLSLFDLSMTPTNPDADSIEVRVTCTNRDLPSRLPFRIGEESLEGADRGDLQIEGTSAVKRVVILTKPTSPKRIPLGNDSQWRLISHLSLNYLSLVEDGGETLKQILMLYNFESSSSLEKHIAGIVRVKGRREFAPITTDLGITFARGVRVEIEFDEDQFVGGGVYLFASVLEHFLGLYTSLNSFTRLSATTTQRKEVLREWPTRAGQKILV